MDTLHDWRSWPLFNNSLSSWLIAGAITLVVLATLLLLRPVVRRYSERLRLTDRTEILEIPMQVLSRTTLPFLVLVGVFLGLQALELGPKVNLIVRSAMMIALFWQAGVWAAAAVRAW